MLVVLVVLTPVGACAVYTRRKATEPEPTAYRDMSSGEHGRGTIQMKENDAYVNNSTDASFSCQLYKLMVEEPAKPSAARTPVDPNTPSVNSRGNTLEYDYVLP